jgi:hypothetical protein
VGNGPTSSPRKKAVEGLKEESSGESSSREKFKLTIPAEVLTWRLQAREKRGNREK